MGTLDKSPELLPIRASVLLNNLWLSWQLNERAALVYNHAFALMLFATTLTSSSAQFPFDGNYQPSAFERSNILDINDACHRFQLGSDVSSLRPCVRLESNDFPSQSSTTMLDPGAVCITTM